MKTYEVDVGGKTYEVDAPDPSTAWQWANQTHEANVQKHNATVAADQQGMRERFAEEEKQRPLQERVRANIGAGMHSLGQGLGGLFGLTNADDVQEAKAIKHQLAETTPGGEYIQMAGETLPTLAVPAGFAGRVLTKAVPRLAGVASRAIGGRAASAADVAGSSAAMVGATTPGDFTERATAAAMAAGAGVALPAAVGIAQAGRRAATRTGRELAAGEGFLQHLGTERADELLDALSTQVTRKGKVERMPGQMGPTRQTLAGVQRPTAAQLTGDATLNQLETGARTKVPQAFAAGDEAAAQGRWDTLHDIAGTPNDLKLAEDTRNAVTGPMREQALAAAGNVHGFEEPVIQKALEMSYGASRSNPQVQRMVNYVIGELDKGVTPEQLYTMRKTLTNGIPHGTELGAAISQSRHERVALVNAIDEAMDRATGGKWTPYMSEYQRLSGPVTSLKAGQAIERDFAAAANTTGAGDPVLTAGKLRRSIQTRGQKQFGGKTFPRFNESERARLGAVADSAEAQTAASMSQGLQGSRTAGNIAAGDNVSALAGGVGKLVGGIPGAVIGNVLPKWHGKRAEEVLAHLLQDPEMLARVIEQAKGAQRLTNAVGESARFTRNAGDLME